MTPFFMGEEESRYGYKKEIRQRGFPRCLDGPDWSCKWPSRLSIRHKLVWQTAQTKVEGLESCCFLAPIYARIRDRY